MGGTLAAAIALVLAVCSGASASASWTGVGAPQTIRQAPLGGAQARHTRAYPTAAASLGELWTYDYGNTRSGHDTIDPPIKSLSAKAVWDDDSLDGGVYGEPLVYDATVYVATENDSLYAIAAGTGKVLWHLHVGTSVAKPVFDSAPTLSGGCGDIGPLGITGTPVIDVATDEIFVAEETELAGQKGWQGIRHWLVAINMRSHQVLWHRDIDPPYGNSPSHYFIPAEQQRPAITLANGRLYVGFGGLDGDCGQYHGYVVGLPVTGSGPLGSYQVPTQREGAIWETNGAVVSPQGDLYVATGNGSSDTAAAFDEGDAVVELSPALKRIGYWAPSNWAQLNDTDSDLGSAGPINVPGTSLLFVAGKPSPSGDYGYLMSEGHLAGIGNGAYTAPACPGGGDFGADASDVIGIGKSAANLHLRSVRKRDRGVPGHDFAHGVPPCVVALVREPERAADRGGRSRMGPRLGRRGPVRHEPGQWARPRQPDDRRARAFRDPRRRGRDAARANCRRRRGLPYRRLNRSTQIELRHSDRAASCELRAAPLRRAQAASATAASGVATRKLKLSSRYRYALSSS